MCHAFLKVGHEVEVVQRCHKVLYESRKKAMQIMKKGNLSKNRTGLIGHGSGIMNAYRCFCGAWHLGHK